MTNADRTSALFLIAIFVFQLCLPFRRSMFPQWRLHSAIFAILRLSVSMSLPSCQDTVQLSLVKSPSHLHVSSSILVFPWCSQPANVIRRFCMTTFGYIRHILAAFAPYVNLWKCRTIITCETCDHLHTRPFTFLWYCYPTNLTPNSLDDNTPLFVFFTFTVIPSTLRCTIPLPETVHSRLSSPFFVRPSPPFSSPPFFVRLSPPIFARSSSWFFVGLLVNVSSTWSLTIVTLRAYSTVFVFEWKQRYSVFM